MGIKHIADDVKGPLFVYLGHFHNREVLVDGHNTDGIGVTPLGGGVLQIAGSDYEDTLRRSGVGEAANSSFPLNDAQKYNMAIKIQGMK